MSVTRVLLDVLIVLVAAKLAAELAERAGFPAVVGEIVAGIVIGPSALALVHGDEVLHVLGELGVILLLLDVGLEMDLAELGAVGRAAVAVASVGVVVPFAAGFAFGLATGMTSNEALFVGAALTATSVGITARVFGDLRALASVEARTVVGAAVADDVMGLVILTVVGRLATDGHVSVGGIATVVGIAVAFLAITTTVGVKVAPVLFGMLTRHSRSTGTLVAIALAFTLAFSELASAAKLAPIVGAFVAGVALRRSEPAERIRRDLTPVGHLFIPVFFLQIGIDADVRQFLHPSVLLLAGGLLLVAVAGKLASSVGLWGSPGDRLLVGLGMVPRGEVGLIFATLGLRQHVFGEDVYAALLLVVLVTTLAPPPLLRWRLLTLRRRTTAGVPPRADGHSPDATLLRRDGTFDLEGVPTPEMALRTAFEAARMADEARPGPAVLAWLSSLDGSPARWNDDARRSFFRVLERGGYRAWRLLALTGALEWALPELGTALRRRQADPAELDPIRALRWPRLERAQRLLQRYDVSRPERVLLAAAVLDTVDDDSDASAIAERVVRLLDLGPAAEAEVVALVADAALLPAAARRPMSYEEEQVLRLAVHLGSEERAHAQYVLTLAIDALDEWELDAVTSLHALVQQALRRAELTGRDAASAVDSRRTAAKRLVASANVRERIDAAPRSYVLSVGAADLATGAALCEPAPRGNDVRCVAVPLEDGRWKVAVAARDRVGLLARETLLFAGRGLGIEDAVATTWGDGTALGQFVLSGSEKIDGAELGDALEQALPEPLVAAAMPALSLHFDDDSSPWHTVCQVEGPDQPGLLHAVTAAIASAGASVHTARVGTPGGTAVDVFEITDKNGRKLTQAMKDSICDALASGVETRRRGRRRGNPLAVSARHR